MTEPHMIKRQTRVHKVASRRMLMFALLAALTTPIAAYWLDWRLGLMVGFDVAAMAYIISCGRLLRLSYPKMIEAHAEADEENRWALLGISGTVMIVILAAVASELMAGSLSAIVKFPMIISTIILAWVFGNMVYALHYAHMHYGVGRGCDDQGLEFPGTPEPNYWDFVYFSFTNGMAFATSDVNIHSPMIRRAVILHCMGAFVFNIGVIGFTINLLAGLH